MLGYAVPIHLLLLPLCTTKVSFRTLILLTMNCILMASILSLEIILWNVSYFRLVIHNSDFILLSPYHGSSGQLLTAWDCEHPVFLLSTLDLVSLLLLEELAEAAVLSHQMNLSSAV